MRICQVQPGILEIKPIGQMGWGAVEKIIREYKSSFEKLGHEVDIKYLNEVNQDEYDIIHIHMANLCIEAKNKGIPYIFSLHDHHTEYNGKDSFIFKQNLEAMKGSIFSITHAEHLIKYFNDVDKLFYVSHGVNTDFFTPKFKQENTEHKLLMVANNGIAGNQGIDRNSATSLCRSRSNRAHHRHIVRAVDSEGHCLGCCRKSVAHTVVHSHRRCLALRQSVVCTV